MEHVFLAINNKGNRRVLAQWLSKNFRVTEADDFEHVPSDADLCIVDSVIAVRARAAILACRQAVAPNFMPVLLIASEGPQRPGNDIWAIVDEMIVAPIAKEELQARMQSLLRTRALTVDLLNAKAQADAANQAKSSFLAHMSHELRTPLNAIIGLTELLRMDQKDPVQGEMLEQVAASGNHLLSVINNVLDLSRIEAGQLLLDETQLDMSQVVQNTVAMVASQARSKGLQLATEIERVPFALSGDSTRLRQALLNLAANAVKFTDRGSVTLRMRLQEDRGEQALICFEVSDTGPGLSPQAVERLFTPFYQAGVAEAKARAGTGLGLAITRHLATMMGGSAGVSSTEGEGSTFWFTVCLRKVAVTADRAIEAQRQRAADVLASEFAGRTVLLVEDNAVNQEVAKGLLRFVDIEVHAVPDGQASVALFEVADAPPYSLVLMDMEMPRMNGLDAARSIRALPSGQRIPIIALTANAFVEDRDRCLAAGMDDFLTKPIDADKLYATLLKWLRQAA